MEAKMWPRSHPNCSPLATHENKRTGRKARSVQSCGQSSLSDFQTRQDCIHYTATCTTESYHFNTRICIQCRSKTIVEAAVKITIHYQSFLKNREVTL